MSFNAVRENKIIAKISGFTVPNVYSLLLFALFNHFILDTVKQVRGTLTNSEDTDESNRQRILFRRPPRGLNKKAEEKSFI